MSQTKIVTRSHRDRLLRNYAEWNGSIPRDAWHIFSPIFQRTRTGWPGSPHHSAKPDSVRVYTCTRVCTRELLRIGIGRRAFARTEGALFQECLERVITAPGYTLPRSCHTHAYVFLYPRERPFVREAIFASAIGDSSGFLLRIFEFKRRSLRDDFWQFVGL